MATLATYLLEVRRLLRDANGNYYSDSELTDYINDGRTRIVRDSGCNRILQTITLTAGTETVDYLTLPQGINTIDVINATVLWGNSRIVLSYLAWSDFNTKGRYWQNFTGRPSAFSTYGQGQIYFAPIPDIDYGVELDTIVVPVNLVLSTDAETLPIPFTSPVAYWAAHKAKYREQSYGEADKFKETYVYEVRNAIGSTYTRRVRYPYNV